MITLRYVAAILALPAAMALAGPGPHGPNGEHLEKKEVQVRSGAGPRMETFTETFELVGRLEDDGLLILIDRYDTNEPVLNGKVEVEVGELRASARFHADQGHYAIDDERFLKALAKPGKHALAFTVSANGVSDLMEGVIEVQPPMPSSATARSRWPYAAVALCGLLAIGAWLHARRKKKGNAQ